MPYSSYIESLVNKLLFGRTGSPYTPPATLYIAASTTAPATDGSGVTEPVGNAYARVAVTNDGTNWVAATSQPGSGQAQANGTVISFPKATGAWGTVGYFAIYDAASGGNFWGHGPLGTPQVIANGGTLSFAVQALIATLA